MKKLLSLALASLLLAACAGNKNPPPAEPADIPPPTNLLQ